MKQKDKTITFNILTVDLYVFIFVQLSKDDIESMRDKGVDGSKIIEELIENSASFNQKTR